MAINTDLLVAAPMLQDYLVDTTGIPLSAGTITCYQDTSRTTLKNWYYQTGTPGAYTYAALPNPLTLSAAGTICDVNGVDTLPFFYPYNESNQSERQAYYITVKNSEETTQFTRANFPFMAAGDGGGDTTSTVAAAENYLINNVFWRNIETADLSAATSSTFVCPSQHYGFKTPNMTFIKSKTGATDTLTFMEFGAFITPPLTDDPTPEYYINHTCSVATTGETYKYYQIPFSLHVNTVSSFRCTFTMQAKNTGGTGIGQDTIGLYVYQDTGTGGVPVAPTFVKDFVLNSSWEKYTWTFDLPPTQGLTLGSDGDDATYILLQMPLNVTCSINFTKPSLYLATEAPTNSFQTYDQIDTIINSPGVINVQYLTTSGTYTKSEGASSCMVMAIAGGGGGGGVPTTTGGLVAAAGGGGGGSAGMKYYATAPTGTAYTIGAGGTAGIGVGANAGGNGGATTFNAGDMNLLGGSGGAGGGTGGGVIGIAKGGDGGLADASDNSDVQYPGTVGAYGLIISAGYFIAGTGGAAGNGSAGANTNPSLGTGLTPSGYGGGGGGATNTSAVPAYDGGAGAPGLIVVYEYA